MNNRSLFFSLLFLFTTALSFHDATAQSDVSGYWVCEYALGESKFPQDLTLSQSGGAVIGEGGYVSSDASVFTVSGTVTGNQFDFYDDYIGSSYAASSTCTVSGNSMDGTWADTNGLNGTFNCTRSASGGSSSSSSSSSQGTIPAVKRTSAIQLFCNRSGPTLAIATCSATVSDTGAHPRITPTGPVNLVATGGFFPSATACQLSPVSFSTGVSSCQAQFTVPEGFTIGAKFPIDVTYLGNAALNPSSTSHKLIISSCIGDSNTPCSGAVALEFADNKILENKIKAVVGCGSRSSPRAAPKVPHENKPAPSCDIQTSLEIPIEVLLNDFGEGEWRDISESITASEAKADPVLKLIKEIGERNAAELIPTFENQLKHSKELMEANQKYLRQQLQKERNKRVAKTPKPVILSVGESRVSVKSGLQKAISIKFNARGKRILNVIKRGIVSELPVRVSVAYTKPNSRKIKKLVSLPQKLGIE